LKAQRSYLGAPSEDLLRPRSESFACELDNFACETILFRQAPRKLLKSLGHEISEFVVLCDFKRLRRVLFRAFFAVGFPIRRSGPTKI